MAGLSWMHPTPDAVEVASGAASVRCEVSWLVELLVVPEDQELVVGEAGKGRPMFHHRCAPLAPQILGLPAVMVAVATLPTLTAQVSPVGAVFAGVPAIGYAIDISRIRVRTAYTNSTGFCHGST